jgi:hypothetical protein
VATEIERFVGGHDAPTMRSALGFPERVEEELAAGFGE